MTLRDEALDDLVDRLMRGEAYPPGVHRGQQINRLDVLRECDQSDIAEAVNEAIKESQKEAAKKMQQMGGFDSLKGMLGGN